MMLNPAGPWDLRPDSTIIGSLWQDYDSIAVVVTGTKPGSKEVFLLDQSFGVASLASVSTHQPATFYRLVQLMPNADDAAKPGGMFDQSSGKLYKSRKLRMIVNDILQHTRKE